MKFPFYPQLDAMDCGPACLRMIASYYGRHYPLENLRRKCYITKEGVSMLGMSEAADAIGLRSQGVRITWDQLCESVSLPCIIHWNQHHFVVVYRIRRHRNGDATVYVADPDGGLLKYTRADFLKCWSTSISEDNPVGLALLLSPTSRFFQDAEDADRTGLSFAGVLKHLKPYRRYIIQILLGLLTGSIISLIFPFLTQSVVDVGIGNDDLHFIVLILIAQVMLAVGQTANELIRGWLMLHVTTRIGITLISDFLSKLMRLPIAFFDSKRIGDLLQRIDDSKRIQTFLTGAFISITMALITFVAYSIVMAWYDLLILCIFFLGSGLYVGWVLIFLKRRRKLDYMRFQQAAANQSSLVQMISGMQDIKLNNCERQKRWKWERIQAQMYRIEIKGLALGQIQQVGGLFINQAKNIFISFLAAKAVIDGQMTLGMMMALQYIIGQLNAPIIQLIGFIQAAQDAKLSMERLNEVHNNPDEEPEQTAKICHLPSDQDIRFENVVFQYEGPQSEKVLDQINLTIPARRTTAIVGASGSGKTTLLKLILGFYQPVEGRVLLGKIPLTQYSDSLWRRHCGVVMQDGYIFSDSIANNIAISDEYPDMERVRTAADIGNISSFIDTLSLGYDTQIGADGHGLSSGQRQRMLIARAAYKNADYLLFDEATNALDANNERTIMEKLTEFFRNKTVVVVAHRLSTVKHADQIVVLDQGRIVEQGTHAELIRSKGYYYRLVKNQLELDN